MKLSQVIRKEDGFTIAEMAVYGAILVFLISGIYTIYEGSEAIYSSTSGQAQAQLDGRIAQASMTKRLRMSESFVEAKDHTIKFRADVDDDGSWDEIHYYVENSNLYTKVNNGVARKLAGGVRNQSLNQPLLIYYDNHGFVISNEADRITKTYQMEVRLIIDTDVNRPPEVYTLSSRVALRNVD